jgi:hypothetical protein
MVKNVVAPGTRRIPAMKARTGGLGSRGTARNLHAVVGRQATLFHSLCSRLNDVCVKLLRQNGIKALAVALTSSHSCDPLDVSHWNTAD